MRQTQGTIDTTAPDWGPWLRFFLRALGQQKRRLTAKVEREKLTLAPLPELSARIIELAQEQGRITMGEMIRLTGASRNTLNSCSRVVARGHGMFCLESRDE